MQRGAIIKVTVADLKTACSQCNLQELCLPFGLENGEIEQLDELIGIAGPETVPFIPRRAPHPIPPLRPFR